MIFTVFHAVVRERWSESARGLMRVQADHQRRTLEILVQRPHLTDGAIFTAAGASSLLDVLLGIEGESELIERARSAMADQGMPGLAVRIDARKSALEALEYAEIVAKSTIDRLAGVCRHLDERFWQRWIRRLKARSRRDVPWRSSADLIRADID